MKQNIIILGASGFIGKNILLYFIKKKNYNVFGTYFKNKFNVKGAKLYKADLTKKKDAEKVIKGMDIVIQAAATTSGAQDILARPYIHVNDNAIINSMVTRAAYDFSVKHVINFSCTVMYKSSKKKLKEKDFNANEEIYPNYFGAAWMKVFVEKLCEFYSRFGRNKYTVIRHSNVYGKFDKFDLEKSHVLGANVTKVLKNKNGKLYIWGAGNEKRDFLYIDDLVEFVELSIRKQKKIFGLYNAGTGKMVSINNLIKLIIRISKKKIVTINDLSKKSLNTYVCLNCDKAFKEIGWKPKTILPSGIEKTIKWYNKNY